MRSSLCLAILFLNRNTPTLPHTLVAGGLAIGLSLFHAGCGADSTVTRYALNLAVNGGSASSRVVSQPAGIACGSTCAAPFESGTVVTLSAQTVEPDEFVGWEGACSGVSPTCSLTLDDEKNVTAGFQVRQLRVDLEVSGNGVVTSMPQGLSCPGTCSAVFPANTVLNLIATPDNAAEFTGWAGACASFARTCTLIVSAPVQSTARFGNPAGCAELRTLDPSMQNGNYTLFVNGDPAKPFAAFCQTSGAAGLTYLNLSNTGANQNFSQYTAGGSTPGVSVRTRYTKVRIDPATLRIDTNAQTFSTTTGGPVVLGGVLITSMPYASAAGCNGSANGLANIDLTGTPFAVATAALAVGGFAASGTATPTPNGQVRVVNLTGGGSCGWNASAGSSGPTNQTGLPLALVYFP